MTDPRARPRLELFRGPKRSKGMAHTLTRRRQRRIGVPACSRQQRTERRQPFRVAGIEIGAPLNEKLDHVGVSLRRSDMHRGAAGWIGRVDIAAERYGCRYGLEHLAI